MLLGLEVHIERGLSQDPEDILDRSRAWRVCELALNAGLQSSSERQEMNDGAAFLEPRSPVDRLLVWIRNSTEEFFDAVGHELTTERISAQCGPPFSLERGVARGLVCASCRWFDMDEPFCLPDCVGHLDFGVPVEECLDGSYLAPDADSWLQKDALVHRQRYAAACTPREKSLLPPARKTPSQGTMYGGALEASTVHYFLLGAAISSLFYFGVRILRSRQDFVSMGGYTAVPTSGGDFGDMDYENVGDPEARAASHYSGLPAMFSKWTPKSRSSAKANAGAHAGGFRHGCRLGSAPIAQSPFSSVPAEHSVASSATDPHWSSDVSEAQEIIQSIEEELKLNIDAPEKERKKLLRRHQMRWHPDKNTLAHRDIATEVTQYLNSQREWFLSSSFEQHASSDR